ncbi:hypothetical protein FHR83_006959 [Actinoplanes campanulatus]|uniref:Uncharacterized protein n=1 Tax=Actinoplanes campanulatus TaxID=113559 RepID=A0A7W5AN13_9ACTN|nr:MULTISPECIES: hypothetical protein [Actinoplanes]MBB3099253.1 hypothetical protein [Actinoplanes campanulatus]GGN40784.1 hypothetical protein GCM10010109_70320 [Actinoplanes campanulatus]GID40571.1 hypothetical protein Aca09nite_70770 [Actinoplanes campanulatus]GID47422.1 hypothetical protein Aca07nite_46970 [Actinoplanes capillaceus]
MAIAHLAVLSAALSALLILPCAATIMLSGQASDLRHLLTRRGRRELRARNGRDRAAQRHLARRSRRRVERGPRGRHERASLRRLERGMKSWDPSRLAALRPPPIERIAYELRRLDQQRRSGLVAQSEALFNAVMLAYDTYLRMACRCLGVPERLQSLTGSDLDLERLRVEATLEAAGLILRRETGPSA